MLLIDAIANNFDQDSYLTELISKAELLVASKFLNFSMDYMLVEKETMDLLRVADVFSNSSQEKFKNRSYYIVTLLIELECIQEQQSVILSAILTKLGNFPALKYYEKNFRYSGKLPLDRTIEKLFKEDLQRIPNSEGTFTDTQFLIFEKLKDSKNFSFSGPTSMGKSFLILKLINYLLTERIAHKIIIVVPTKALINQFTFDLKKELRSKLIDNECIIYSNSPRPNLNPLRSEILILTPERVLTLLSEKSDFVPDYIIVDEAHKLASEDDSRSITYYKSLQRLVSNFKSASFIFSSPNVTNPETFVDLYKLDKRSSFSSDRSVVSQNLYYLDLLEGQTIFFGKYGKYSIQTPLNSNYSDSLEVINNLGADCQNIVYCSTPAKAVDYALTFSRLLPLIDDNPKISKAITKVKKFIHKDFFLVDCLERGVAFHYGRIPHEIRIEIEELFKEGHIKNIFCTSTLLEGVNLPAKNIFILSNRKGNKPFDQIDFWNLSGRAGRLTKELSGNIICLRDKERDWKNIDYMINKNSLVAVPTVISQSSKYESEIETILSGQEIKKKITLEKKNILKYISNIISIETATPDQSPLVDSLKKQKFEKIIDLATKLISTNSVPFYILNMDPSISIQQQNSAYDFIISKKDHLDLRFPNTIDYENCLRILIELSQVYKWTESSLNTEKKLTRIAFLMSSWMQGYPLSAIIYQSIRYHHDNNRVIYLGYSKRVEFDRLNRVHVNILITGLIDDIESILRFQLQKYLNNYYTLLSEVIGKDNAGNNWGEYLEYGTSDNTIIQLQNLGLSRQLAQIVKNEYPHSIKYVKEVIDGIDYSILLDSLDRESLEYDEVSLLAGE